jgi:hypothetical protein
MYYPSPCVSHHSSGRFHSFLPESHPSLEAHHLIKPQLPIDQERRHGEKEREGHERIPHILLLISFRIDMEIGALVAFYVPNRRTPLVHVVNWLQDWSPKFLPVYVSLFSHFLCLHGPSGELIQYSTLLTSTPSTPGTEK